MSKLKGDQIPPNPHARTIVKPVRFNMEEEQELMTKAHLYTKGNESALVRLAVKAYRPFKKTPAK